MPELSDPNDVIVRVMFVGVCGSDVCWLLLLLLSRGCLTIAEPQANFREKVHFWKHGGIQTPITEPLVMGHEASGIIEAVGSTVTSLKVGDRVTVEPGHPCRRCRACKHGRYNLCPTIEFAAAPPRVHGTLAKFWKSPSDYVYKIRDGARLEEAVLIEPLSVAVHVTRLANIQPGQTVIIIGSGTIGLLSGAVATVFGASRILLLDIVEDKLSFAHDYLGVETHLINPKATPEENAASILSKFGPEDNVDAVIEASGAEPSVQLSIHLLNMGGTLVQAGMGKAQQQIPMLAMIEKELNIRGSFRYGPGDFPLAVKLWSQGSVNLKPLISSITPFERATEAWDKTARGEGIKNLIAGVRD